MADQGSAATRSGLLLSAPTEIRHMVYSHLLPDAVHVFRLGRTLRLSACITPLPICREDSGSRRSPDSNLGLADPVWANRLSSSWGPHWACEEASLQENYHADFMSLPLVCKAMFVCANLFIYIYLYLDC